MVSVKNFLSDNQWKLAMPMSACTTTKTIVSSSISLLYVSVSKFVFSCYQVHWPLLFFAIRCLSQSYLAFLPSAEDQRS
uniref:Uncharacterized protein n=1 Tax=Arundo donax TaxID=35708 RepID=A0A0A9F9G2_ARUDO